MFRKLVTNLPFQPAVLGQIARYLKQLKKDSLKWKTALLGVVAVFMLQLVFVIYPSEYSLSTNTNDIIYGAKTKNQIIQAYINNRDNLGRTDIKAIYDHYGIGVAQIYKLSPKI